MAHAYKISEYGINLIKAYEGFKAVETTLVSGQRVIGFGHVPAKDEATTLNKKQAEVLLGQDLEPFESLVNNHVFAPLSQNTFDALVSLSFNIGPEAFLGSEVLHALNMGRPLKAASGFDAWRKGRIGGKIYVVDALVRRRAAEKALFLSPHRGVVSASRHELPPIHDVEMMKHRREDDVFVNAAVSTNTPMEVVGDTTSAGVVAHVPYIARSNDKTPRRRKEDKAASVLTLSERAPDLKLVEDKEYPEQTDNVLELVREKARGEQSDQSGTVVKNLEAKPDGLYEGQVSPIAAAAAEVSERLDNLMDENVQEFTAKDDVKLGVQPADKYNETIIEQGNGAAHALEAPNSQVSMDTGERTDSSSKLNVRDKEYFKGENSQEDGPAAYWTVLAVGLFLLLAAVWKLQFSKPASLDAISAFLAPVALLIGAMLLIGGVYYLIKNQARHVMT